MMPKRKHLHPVKTFSPESTKTNEVLQTKQVEKGLTRTHSKVKTLFSCPVLPTKPLSKLTPSICWIMLCCQPKIGHGNEVYCMRLVIFVVGRAEIFMEKIHHLKIKQESSHYLARTA